MTTSYDTTVVGVARCLITDININYPATGVPSVVINQTQAVTMADGSTQLLQPLGSISATLDPIANGNTPVQMVDFHTGLAIPGQFTTLNEVMIKVLAIARSIQVVTNP
jgi:hypothetical protein